MRDARPLLLALLSIVLLVACAPAAPATVAKAAQAPVVPATAPVDTSVPKTPLKEAWQVKWDAMVEGARKEGKVVIYSSASAETRVGYQQAFKKRFGINAEFVAGAAAATGSKVMAERKAGLRLGDLFQGSGNMVLLTLKPAGYADRIEVGDVLILPESSDPKLWRGGKFFWQDADHTSLSHSRYESNFIARNTELVKEGEIQSLNDLLNPKWKGKIVFLDIALAGRPVISFSMVGHSMGWDWVRAFAKQDPVPVQDFRVQVEWLAHGKYALAFAPMQDQIFAFQKIGAPVAVVGTREGGYLSSGNGMITLLKDAPHPNAARVFVNWLVSQEGQEIFTSTSGYPSSRLDVSDAGATTPRAASDTKAVASDTEEAYLKQPEDLKIMKEILLPVFKK